MKPLKELSVRANLRVRPDSKTKKHRAKKLPIATRRRIGRHWQKTSCSIPELAEQFGITHDQARSIVADTKSGALDKPNSTKHEERARAKARASILSRDPADILEEQYGIALADLSLQSELSASERIKLLDALSKIKRTIQQTRLEGHIRTTDAGVIMNIMRRFQPNLTEEGAITIYREELEKWRGQNE
jgi:hypothetical protein